MDAPVTSVYGCLKLKTNTDRNVADLRGDAGK